MDKLKWTKQFTSSAFGGVADAGATQDVKRYSVGEIVEIFDGFQWKQYEIDDINYEEPRIKLYMLPRVVTSADYPLAITEFEPPTFVHGPKWNEVIRKKRPHCTTDTNATKDGKSWLLATREKIRTKGWGDELCGFNRYTVPFPSKDRIDFGPIKIDWYIDEYGQDPYAKPDKLSDAYICNQLQIAHNRVMAHVDSMIPKSNDRIPVRLWMGLDLLDYDFCKRHEIDGSQFYYVMPDDIDFRLTTCWIRGRKFTVPTSINAFASFLRDL